MSQPMIRVEGLGKRYRIGHKRPTADGLRHVIADAVTRPFRRRIELEDLWALRDVTFDVAEGEVLGVIGRNGAGKSTLLKVLSRITPPTEGVARLRGRVGSLLEVGTGFHPELTGRENVYLNGAILGMRRREIAVRFDEIVAFAEIEKFLDMPVKRYSSGMYVRLAFAIAAHLQPEILLVDEVLAVGDVRFQKKCLGKMGEVARGGRTVLFVSHNMSAVRLLCDRAVWLEGGRAAHLGEAGATVDAYLRTAEQEAQEGPVRWPVFDKSEQIGITNLRASVAAGEGGSSRLEIDVAVRSRRPMTNIGVGVLLTNRCGIVVAELGPAVTNFVIERIDGQAHCAFRCEGIDRYLIGGEYIVGIWLARPRVEYLVRIDHAAVVTVPLRDVYGSGVNLDQQHGVVPLPVTFAIREP
ncbi:hypothetical protein LCGC14_0204170 [marine sediment metagenome]|uniref:ABC transporter domain-containing protein n=1 Tax=marine sediment metagenome TaxID=412755 RepID=A0A0F9XLA3_9ZZZZ|nr:ABC transporter ATP-binding protein [Phycisphaerae bacterium]HDZ43441.1 ABC transporter ATP-binding protein [Phycisphaerae bacterium]